MLPSFLQTNDGAQVGASVVRVPPPPKFRPIRGNVRNVGIGGSCLPSRGTSRAQKAGVRFESRVQRALTGRFGYEYVESPVFSFWDESGFRQCIPDGLLKRGGSIVLVEIKSQHMPEAWWQLRKLYEPVIRATRPKRRLLLLEVCKILDAHMPFPEEFNNIPDIVPWADEAEDGSFGVWRW